MADLIERDALLQDMTKRSDGISDWHVFDVINEQPAVNRWIPVEDALPEKNKSYITYAETTKYCNHNEIPEELRINILYFNGEEWYDDECRYYNVTHYMPLPEPPEKE